MSLDENTSRLIGSIYDSVGDPTAWVEVLATLVDRTSSRFLMVSAVDLSARNYHDTYWSGPDDGRFLDGVRDYEAAQYRDDPTLWFASRNPLAGRIDMRTALAQEGRDPVNDPYVRWVRGALGTSDTLVRYTAPTDGMTLGMSLHAHAAAGGHSQQAVKLFLLLFEHVERAVRLAARPPDWEDGSKAVVLIASDGRIIQASESADAILKAGDGLRRVDNRLAAASATHDRRLNAMIRSALDVMLHGTAGGAVTLPRPSGRADLLVRADPLPQGPQSFQLFRPATIVTLVEPDAIGRDLSATRRWAQAFGLTPAETRLSAALMAHDESLRSVARQLGIAYATARVHLASIFEKTGTRSQAQLARLLARLGGWALAVGTAFDQAAVLIA